jgi:radical SAM protein with 4Fe4S-binding SPASM domain
MYAQIEVNKNCNIRCWFCQNSQYDVPPNKVMSMGDFQTIVDKITNTWTPSQLWLVSFAAYNEPTLDPHFKERLMYLTSKGLTYWWISNGTNMTPDIVDFLVNGGARVSDMHFNMPSCDPRRLSQLVGLSEAKAEKSLLMFEDFMRRLPEVGLKATITVHGNSDESNVQDAERIRKWASPYGVDVKLGGAMDRAGMLENVGRKVNHVGKVDCAVGYLSNLYVGVTGNLYMCCHDYYQTTEYGNLLKDNPHDLISSFHRVEACRKLQSEFCSKCEFAKQVR